VLEGIPGLSDIPLIGRLFAHNQRQIQETDIVVTLTPRIIRLLDLEEEDLRAFRVERDTSTGLDISAPLPAPLPLSETQPTAPTADSPDGAVPIIPFPPTPPR